MSILLVMLSRVDYVDVVAAFVLVQLNLNRHFVQSTSDGLRNRSCSMGEAMHAYEQER